MLSTVNGAALVKGAAPTAPKTVKVEVTRAFCIAGGRLEVGTVLDVSASLARELAANGKAVPYIEKPAPARPAAPKEKSK